MTDRLLRRGRRWAAESLLAIVLLIALAPAAAQAQEWRTVSVSRQRQGETSLDVRIGYGAGKISLRSAPAGVLYRMRLRHDEDEEPEVDFDGRSLRLGIQRQGRPFRGGSSDSSEMDVALAPGLPMDLLIEFGAGRADLDLGGLSLRNLTIRTGASETRLDVSRPNPETLARARLQVGAADFTARRLGNLNARLLELNAGVGDVTLDLTGAWKHDATVVVEMGLGALELRVPEGMGLALETETLLTSVDTQGLVKRGDAYYSVDWDRAERRVTVKVRAAFGNVDVRWVR